MKSSPIPANVKEYISGHPPATRKLLNQMRDAIRKAAPEAEETISYQMPAYKQNGMLVYFAAFKNHIGFYPTASGIAAFQKELSSYKGAKGSVQFPIDEPIPIDLVTRIVQFRVKENRTRASATAKSKKK